MPLHEKQEHLYFDGIKLIPVDSEAMPYALARDKYADSWHLPGGEIASRRALLERAAARGVSLQLQTTDGVRSETVALV